MKSYLEIKNIHAREILDSRGNPTVEVHILADGGIEACASVPSGASTGEFEAVELRDNDEERYNGKGVLKAVRNINKLIAPALEGLNAFDQVAIDNIMLELDGTENKRILGANACLAVSLAVAKVAANALEIGLYQYIGGVNAKVLPVPMMNILNGGRHSDNSVNIQEFMIMPISAESFSEALQMGTEVFHALKDVLKENNYSTAVGDEGGFAPNLAKDEDALILIVEAIKKAGYIPGEEIAIALDAAASEMYTENMEYNFWKSGITMTREELLAFWEDLVDKYPIVSIEDAYSETDYEGWKMITEKLGDRIQLVGDDLFVTNTEKIAEGIDKGAANAVLIKPNQIGTLTETLDAIEFSRKNGYNIVVSHRSGETDDTTISDLVVAVNGGQIKTGAPSRGERVAKYNQLLRIEEELGDYSVFLGDDAIYM